MKKVIVENTEKNTAYLTEARSLSHKNLEEDMKLHKLHSYSIKKKNQQRLSSQTGTSDEAS